jgi:hypothetical protein
LVKRWKKAEEHVRDVLEREFDLLFQGRVIRFGELSRKQFDAVSTNGEIVAMVKAFDKPYQKSTSMQLRTRQDRCIVDCAWLARTSAKIKLLVFVERDYADWFRPYAEFLFPDVVVRWVPGLQYSTEQRTTTNNPRPRKRVFDTTTGRIFPSLHQCYRILLREGKLEEMRRAGKLAPFPEEDNFGYYKMRRSYPGRFVQEDDTRWSEIYPLSAR